MKRFLLSLLLFVFFTPVLAHSSGNTPETLQNDLVTINNKTFLINKYLSCHLSLPPSLGGGTPFNSFTMHVRFQAPASGLISRDIFVAFSMRLFTEAKIRLASEIPGLSTEQTLRAMQCYEVSENVASTEYTYLVKMSKQGVETRIKDKQRNTEKFSHESWDKALRNLPKIK